MKTYTEEEIKKWFEEMKKRYPNSNMFQHLESIEFMMFNKSYDSLEKTTKRIKERSLQAPFFMIGACALGTRRVFYYTTPPMICQYGKLHKDEILWRPKFVHFDEGADLERRFGQPSLTSALHRGKALYCITLKCNTSPR